MITTNSTKNSTTNGQHEQEITCWLEVQGNEQSFDFTLLSVKIALLNLTLHSSHKFRKAILRLLKSNLCQILVTFSVISFNISKRMIHGQALICK